MKRIVLSALLVGAISFPAAAALKSGEAAPDIKAKATLAGKEFNFSLKDALKKGPVVVYFYPAAFSQGCNLEAHAFAEHADQFAAAKATIIGVSADSIERLNAFSSDPQYCAGKFPVVSDRDGAIAKAYDLTMKDTQPGRKDTRGEVSDNTFYIERTTFVILPDGKITATLSTNGSGEEKVKSEEHAAKSLELVQQMAAKH